MVSRNGSPGTNREEKSQGLHRGGCREGTPPVGDRRGELPRRNQDHTYTHLLRETRRPITINLFYHMGSEAYIMKMDVDALYDEPEKYRRKKGKMNRGG